jgi:hypothetical protein
MGDHGWGIRERLSMLGNQLDLGARAADIRRMRSNRFVHITAIAIALVFGCATGAALDNIIVPARAAAGPSYEYMTLDVQATFGMTGGNAEEQTQVLNKFGAEGWRVVGSLGAKLYLERERPAS